ncbi:MAG: hypothetical protein ACRD5B_17390, partial [Nitrososphaeraceae archaeon]
LCWENIKNSCIKGIRVPSLLECLDPVSLLRSWVPLPPSPFLPVIELRHYFELVLGSCPTKPAISKGKRK